MRVVHHPLFGNQRVIELDEGEEPDTVLLEIIREKIFDEDIQILAKKKPVTIDLMGFGSVQFYNGEDAWKVKNCENCGSAIFVWMECPHC